MTHPQTQDDEALVVWWPGHPNGMWHLVTNSGWLISSHESEDVALTALRNHEGRK